ncbi:MAG TPA: ThiF family adenylyltransferase [Mycobacteriales bacterium]|nr:ThiF family adenylyltransferase [Mycobacteriales bacterium]
MSAGVSRPRLNPALRRLWRDTRTLQLGLDPARALIIDGVDPAVIRFVLTLDGRRREPEVLADGAAAGIDIGELTEILAGLRRGGALLDGPEPELEGRLEPDRAGLALLPEPPPGPIFALRAECSVVVHGGGRVGMPLAALLAAAGVGAVDLVDEDPVNPGACVPGGFSPADVRRAARTAARDVLRRAAPGVRVNARLPHRLPDLTILATAYPIESDLRSALQAARLPHLVAGIRETTAIVGPLVLPGRTSCLQCANLHRADRDPAWPLLALQLTGEERRQVPAADAALALTAVGIAGSQALAFLDGRPTAVREATLELAQPDWRIRRRRWPHHPRCDCRFGQQMSQAG